MNRSRENGDRNHLKSVCGKVGGSFKLEWSFCGPKAIFDHLASGSSAIMKAVFEL